MHPGELSDFVAFQRTEFNGVTEPPANHVSFLPQLLMVPRFKNILLTQKEICENELHNVKMNCTFEDSEVFCEDCRKRRMFRKGFAAFAKLGGTGCRVPGRRDWSYAGGGSSIQSSTCCERFFGSNLQE